MKIEPTFNNVLIEPIDRDERTKAGVYISKKAKSQRAKVIAVGRHLVDGVEDVSEVKAGDTIVHKKWEGQEVKLDISGKPFVFIKYKDILAVEENEK